MFYPAEGFGGPVTNTLELAKGLSKKSEMMVFTSTAKNFSDEMKLEEREINGKLKIKYFPITSRMFKQFITPKMKIALKMHLEEFDLVHLHCYRQYQDFIFWFANKRIKKPYYMTMHGAITPLGEKAYLKKIYDILIGKKILKNATKIIVLSKLQKKEALAMGIDERKIVEIPFGVDPIEKFSESQIFQFNKNKKYVLYLGRIDKSKGIDHLIRAFKKIHDENVELLIVGPNYGFSNYCKELSKKLQLDNRVRFLGAVEHSNLLEIFKISNVLVLPSKYDATGTVTLEAASFGIPIILTDKCGLAEEFKKRDAGKVVTAGDINELEIALNWIFENPQDTKIMGKKGQKYAQSLTWEYCVSEHIKTYESTENFR
jgi:glycosyltransferase involved in cell wall biosynthesis